MYNRNPIGSGAPDFAAMFAPPVYTPPKDATENNLSSIAALQDPTGTLQRMQAEKVIGAMADLKTDGIDNIYRQRALDAINGFQQFATGLYGKNTGLNRLTLDGQQQLEQTQKARETLTDLNALRGLSADYRKTIDEAAQDFKSGTITREDYNRFVTELDGLTSGAKSIGDLPMAHAVYNRFLMNKPEAYNLKKETEFANQMFGLYKQWNYTEGGTMGRNPQNVRRNIDNTLPPGSQQWAILDSELSTRNFYPPSAVTEDQRREFLTKASISGYNPKEVGQSTSIYNNYGVKNPVMANYTKEGNKTVWDFPKRDIPYTKDKVSGYLTAVYKEGDKWYGEFSVDQMVDSPNQSAFDFGVKKVKNRFGNDVYTVELDASDYSRVMAAGYQLEDGDKFGWNTLRQQRDRKGKSKDSYKSEAQQLGL